jgi:N-methylhydantoinase B
MRFSENGFYIERYIKCGTCGVLIYESEGQPVLTHDGVTYCSQWCIDWKIAREKRRADLERPAEEV